MTTVEQAAEALRAARESVEPIHPLRTQFADPSIDTAYEIQQLNTQHDLSAGRRLIGWKIGLTAKVVQAQLGVDQPDFGPLFADMAVGDDEAVSLGALIAPRAEAEVAFVLERALDLTPVTVADVLVATGFVVPAIEIVDSRIRDWDISIFDTVADNASSGMFVLGTTPRPLSSVDLVSIEMVLRFADDVVSQGSGAQCLGNPVNAVVWLANTLAERGVPLQAGDVVLSGALGPMVSVTDPGTFMAELSGLGTVRATFSP